MTQQRTNQQNNKEVRIRTAPQKFELRKNADGSRSISGYAATFNDLSEPLGGFREKIQRGAFAQSLKDNPDVLCLYGHDDNQILGRGSSGTLEIGEDSKGLRFTCKLPDTSTARDLIALMERSDVNSMSFGFICVQDDWSEVNGQAIRTLIEVILLEISVVGMPAYTSTSVSLRSAPANIKRLLSLRAKQAQKTKSVDGIELPATSFAYVGDQSKPDTWKLPIYFPGDEEKTITHIKDALARFNQTEGIPASEQAHVYSKIVGAAKAHGIHVTAEKLSDRSVNDLGYDDTDDTDDLADPDCQEGDDDDCDDDEYSRSAALALLTRKLRS